MCNTIGDNQRIDMTAFIKEKYYKKSPDTNSIHSKLDLIEALLVKIDGTPSEDAKLIFVYLDDVFDQLNSFQENGSEKTKIESQLNYVANKVYASANELIKSFGGAKSLIKIREQKRIPKDRWWWYLDQYLIEKRKKALKKGGLLSLAAIVVIALMAFVYNQFLAPPPEVRARMELEEKIDNLIVAGDYAAAIDEIDLALDLTPDYYPLWIKKGVLAKVLGDVETEKLSFEKAMQLIDIPEYFYQERANIYMQMGLYEGVLADADKLEELNSDSAEAFLYRGLVYEAMGQVDDAYAAYEKATILAEEQNKIQLAATIKVRMGMILQSFSIPTIVD